MYITTCWAALAAKNKTHSGKGQLGQLSIVKHCLHVCLEPPGAEGEHAHGEGHHAQLPNCHHHRDNGWGLRTDNGTVETMTFWTL